MGGASMAAFHVIIGGEGGREGNEGRDDIRGRL